MIKKEKAVKEEKKKPDDDWMTRKWRPMMAIMYMFCCLADFFIFPIMFTVVQFWETAIQNDAFRQWVPITLQGGGLFHVAMGAVLGVSAYGRTQEKLNGATNANTGLQPVSQSVTTTFGAPAAGGFGNSGGFNSPTPASTGFAGNTGFGATTAPATTGGGFGGGFNSTPAVVTGFGGKPAPAPQQDPLL